MPSASSVFSAPPVESLVATPSRKPERCRLAMASRLPGSGTDCAAPCSAVNVSKQRRHALRRSSVGLGIPERDDVGIGAGREDRIRPGSNARRSRSRPRPSARRPARGRRRPHAAPSDRAMREPGLLEIDQCPVLVEQDALYVRQDLSYSRCRASCVDMAHQPGCRGVAALRHPPCPPRQAAARSPVPCRVRRPTGRRN